MENKNGEVTDNRKINEIIESCDCCRLGFYDEGEVYLVPLNFGYEEKEGRRTFFFHGAKNGRKMQLVSKTAACGFELDTNYQLKENKDACQYSARFQSVIGTGAVSFIEDPVEKESALQMIMRHNSGRENWEFSDAMLQAVGVFKLEVEKMSCRERL